MSVRQIQIRQPPAPINLPVDHRQISNVEVLEGGLDLLMLFRQGNPTLNPEQAFTTASRTRWRALGMCDATPGGHEIYRAGRDLERIALAVAMHNAPIKQVGDRGKPDVRVGAHIEPVSIKKLRRPHLIEKNERTNHLALVARQGATDFKAIAQIADSRNDNEFQRIA